MTTEAQTVEIETASPVEHIVHIAMILPVLVNLTEKSQQQVLIGMRVAFLNQHVQVKDETYQFMDIFYDPENGTKIMARIRLMSTLAGVK